MGDAGMNLLLACAEGRCPGFLAGGPRGWPVPRMIATLWRDRIVPAALLVMLVLAVPYVRPVFSRLAFEYYALYAPMIVLLGGLIFAIRRGLRAVRPAAERRFWDLWSTAFSFWLAQALVGLATSARPGPTATLVQDGLLVGFYTPLLLAARLTPDRSDELPPANLLRILEVAGTALFVFGFFGYFSLIPFLFDRPLLATDVPSLTFYTVLDAVVVVRFAVRLGEAASPRWRALYGWLLAGAGLWFLGDVLETLMFVEIVPWRPAGRPSDFVWWLPFVPLLVAARLRSHPFPPAAPSRRTRSWRAGATTGAIRSLRTRPLSPSPTSSSGARGRSSPRPTRPARSSPSACSSFSPGWRWCTSAAS